MNFIQPSILRPVLLAVAFIALSTVGSAQSDGNRLLLVNGGFARPVGPQHFYDYWKDGFVVGGGIGFPFRESIALFGTLDIASFSVDRDRLFKGFGVSPGTSSYGGGSTLILAFGGSARYFQSREEDIPVYASVGVVVTLSNIAEADAEYSGISVHQDSEWNAALLTSFAVGLRVVQTPVWSWFVEGRFHLSIAGGERSNHNFSSVRIVGVKPLTTPPPQ
jgi:hypothetical protein